MGSGKWKTVVVEDQKLFRDLLVRMLKSDSRFSFIDAAEDVEKGFSLCREHLPDLLLLDIQLAGSDGVDLGKRILKEFPGTQILAVTTLTDPDTINRIMDAGIHGYVEKDSDLDVLEKAMVRVPRAAISKPVMPVRRSASSGNLRIPTPNISAAVSRMFSALSPKGKPAGRLPGSSASASARSKTIATIS
jgi:DNA-binding NarL/FixJ family response regulator